MKTAVNVLLTLGTTLAYAHFADAQSRPRAVMPEQAQTIGPGEPKTPPEPYQPTTEFLLKWAKVNDPKRYQYAIDSGVTITPTPDGRSFILTWLPPGTTHEANPSPCPPLIVTLHGSTGWAFNEFYLWHRFAQERGLGIVALQWWRGRDADDYYRPNEIYPLLERALADLKLAPGDGLLHGFSRGSANCYAIAVIDRQRGQKFFSTVIANSGGYESSFPPNASIDRGEFGPAPLAGTRWILYAGGRDPNPKQSGLPAMRRTRDWLTGQHAEVALFIEDPQGDHGGFHHSPEHIRAALDVFANRPKPR